MTLRNTADINSFGKIKLSLSEPSTCGDSGILSLSLRDYLISLSVIAEEIENVCSFRKLVKNG